MFVRTFRFLVPVALVAATLVVPAGAQDIAQGKTAVQSSNWENSYFANLAVDGNTDGVAADGSVTNTNVDQNAWWYVDLGNTYNISSITLWNRTDCCASRLSNFLVDVLASGTPNIGDINAPTTYSTLFSGTAGTTTVFTIPQGIFGQFIKVQFNNHADYLQLAEVQVTGTLGTVTTPEPSSMALLGTGLVGLVPMVRRRRKSV